MTEAEILKWSAISAAVLFSTVFLFAAGGMMLVLLAAVLTDGVLRRVEHRRAIEVRKDERPKL